MRLIFLLISLVTLCGLSHAQEFSSDSAAIVEVFFDQQEAWNQSDIDRFMEGYWKSDKLVFVGAEGPKYGWQQVLENYHERYPNPTAMGKLKFSIIELVRLDRETARQIGKFHLTRSIGNIEGYFTLIWKRFDGKWLIVSDHTSASD